MCTFCTYRLPLDGCVRIDHNCSFQRIRCVDGGHFVVDAADLAEVADFDLYSAARAFVAAAAQHVDYICARHLV